VSQQTYQILQPLATHWRPATCAEVDCPAYLQGWRSVVPEGSPQAAYIRSDRSRRHREESTVGVWDDTTSTWRVRDLRAEGLVGFWFEAGQTCFAAGDHRVPLDRPQIFRVAPTHAGRVAGDIRTHDNGAHWVEDFSIHLDHIRTIRERG
jgi:hypothetical protein